MKPLTQTIDIDSDQAVARARQAGLSIAAKAGFKEADCVKFATAISELARNVVKYAGTGVCEVALRPSAGGRRLEARVIDRGPGIADIPAAMSHGYTTGAGLGVGLPGTRRLVDEFDIKSSPEGTTVSIAIIRGGRARSRHV